MEAKERCPDLLDLRLGPPELNADVIQPVSLVCYHGQF
jgi:hypothetical protein